MLSAGKELFIPVRDYDLSATLTSGQAFGWELHDGAWEGIIGPHWVRLCARDDGILATTAGPVSGWEWLTHYLQTDVDLHSILLSFPDDEPMRNSVTACRGLRLLRQDPWECLASFILSSTKQIVQIQQIVARLCERFGSPVLVPPGHAPAWSFPTTDRLAAATEAELRACKMGFRARSLRETAKILASHEIDLLSLHTRPASEAREILMQFPGVGPKIANCVLLFAYGFQEAFPIDVWVMKGLRQLYFPKRRPTPRRLLRFTHTHFGAHAGYAQQYLFHYMRMKGRRVVPKG